MTIIDLLFYIIVTPGGIYLSAKVIDWVEDKFFS